MICEVYVACFLFAENLQTVIQTCFRKQLDAIKNSMSSNFQIFDTENGTQTPPPTTSITSTPHYPSLPKKKFLKANMSTSNMFFVFVLQQKMTCW